MSKSKEVADEYLSSLADLKFNSKPLINMLTMLADENVDHASAIVQVIESHIEKVSPEIKLPILYLIDSIIKNVPHMYVPLFTQNIVNIFVSVFEKVDEKTRLYMYKLRQTWGDVFPAKKLYELDLRVKDIDQAWPVTTLPPTSIHFNPKFLSNKSNMPAEVSTSSAVTTSSNSNSSSVPPVTTTASELPESVLRDQLLKKQKILIQLQQKKLELELMQNKVILEEQQKHANDTNVLGGLVRPPNIDEAVKLLPKRVTAKSKEVTLPLSSVLNPKSKKTKIAPANTQIIEAVKSRDPRIARQQLLQSKTSEITNKEQEIFNRQLAMLKTPVIDQVVPVTPVQRVLSESNVKGHITVKIERNRDGDKSSGRMKKSTKERSKKDNSPCKSKSKHSGGKDSKSSRSRSSKSNGSQCKDSKSGGKSNRSNNQSCGEGVKNHGKNERSVSPGISKHSINSESTRNSFLESSLSLEPPPPPIISRTDQDSTAGKKKEDINFDDIKIDLDNNKEFIREKTSFKDLKGVSKGRNYMRRNRESSASPEKEGTGDIDLRITGPSEKHPRLLFEEENVDDSESKKLFSESLVNASGKDVDFRILSVGGGSPSKKKLPSDSLLDQPPKKKSKSEAFDELFGHEDVDLRKITAPNLNSGDRLPSPPPPPVISSTGPSVPQIAAVAPLVVVDNPKAYGSENENVHLAGESEKSRNSYDTGRGRHRRTWADVKVKPEAEVKPVSLPGQLDVDIDIRKDSFSSSFETSVVEKGNKKHYRERISHAGELDRLGRPLLYNKLPNDPRARRESLGVLDGRDTDMRRFGSLIDRDIDTNINVNMIVDQAEDQVRNGTMSMHEYNELIKQVIYVNEKQKLREAQTKGRQEVRSRSHQRGRRSPNRYGGSRNRDAPNYRHEDDRRDRRHFNDIDERLHIPWRSLQRNEKSGGYNRLTFPSGSNRSPFELSPLDHRQYIERSPKRDVWEEDKRFRQVANVDEPEASSLTRSRDVTNSERTRDCVDIPPADPQVLELIAKDPMKSISIDGTARDIRFYGDTAVVMLSWDDPKEISFEDGIRRVAIGDTNITCALNESYGIFLINGKPHRIRLGAPTRELYIDGEFYEAHFGGPPIPVQIDGMQYLVQVEGPPPQVKIGKKRLDLICGRVNLIVDATAILPLYLDSKPQRFDLRSRPYIFRFVNSLKTLLVNEVPVDIQFGGVCRQISGYGNLHFLRLSMLPNGIVPGCVKIINMENTGVPNVGNALENRIRDNNSPPIASLPINVNQGTNVLNAVSENTQIVANLGSTSEGSLDMLTSIMNGVAGSEQSVGFNYQVENKDTQPVQSSTSNLPDTANQPPQPQASGIPFLGGSLNINDLFQRLVASGILQTTVNMNTNKAESSYESAFEIIDFSNINTLKEKYQSVVSTLYSGIQCSSCGVRFLPEETLKYSRHLDWHFRQNRREKDAARKMRSRKWYYDVSDWIQFEEIEDLEERAQSWFDTENTGANEDQDQEDVKSVPAPQGEELVRCEMCRDQFDTYYNEEKEEWHLKPCIIVEDKFYHPLCYEDLMSIPEESLLALKSADTLMNNREEESGLRSDSTGANEENEESKGGFPLDEDGMRDPNSSADVLHDFTGSDDYGGAGETKANIKMETETETEREAEAETERDREKGDENRDEFNVDFKIDEQERDDSVIKLLLYELVSCVVCKEEMMLEEKMRQETDEEESKEEEIEVLENVTVEQKKNIIAVDLIEKLDDEDEEEETVYHRRSPSPITFIPNIKIKQEPIDEMESPVAVVDQTYTSVVSSIDGNVEMIDAPQVAPAGPSKIKITFNKPIVTDHSSNPVQKVIIKDANDAVSEEIEPEPLPLRPKKPKIAEREMTVYLPCVKGTEVSGLCTIM